MADPNAHNSETETDEKLRLWGCRALGCIAFCIIFLIVIGLPQLLGSRRSAWAYRAQGTLRSIGSAQLAYQQENDNRVYGSFQALQDTEGIATGCKLGNMIENYSMSWEVNNVSTVHTEEFPTGIISTFTVVAYPRDRRPRFLYTFAITEDQMVRVYEPFRGHPREDVHTWDPLL